MKVLQRFIALLPAVVCWLSQAQGQVPPSASELTAYKGLHAAAHKGDMAAINRLIRNGADLKRTDGRGRAAIHVAAFASHDEVVMTLASAGADPNQLENDKYDIITIAAVANDADMVRTAVNAGGDATNITSIYDGTALIAAAHLGHWESVEVLIEAGAPLDHVNNLGWTALIEAVVLGDGGPRHVKTAKLLIKAGADQAITDRNGRTPMELARDRGYGGMIRALTP